MGEIADILPMEISDLTNSLANDMKHLSCRPDARETVAIICSENTKTKAEELNVGISIQDSQYSNFKREIIVCKDLGCFSDELLKRCERFWILVDSSLMAIVMSKRNFHSEVEKFFERVEENEKKVVVCRDLGRKENEDAIDFYARLPRNCRLWHNEVKLNFMGSSTIEDGGNDVQPEGKKKEEKVKVKEETTAITSEDPGGGRCVQVGSHQTMRVTSTSSKPLQIEQYGENNAVSIKIDPKVKNNVRFVLNSEQLSKEDEDAITTDLKEDEGLEISVKSSGCTCVSITKGSIIIEMDVEPGTNMDKEWLFSLFTLLFEERLRKLFPEGISLDVEVEKTWTVTLQEIESAKKSDLHALCVPKEKYDALITEITELKGNIKESAKKSDLHALCVPKEKYDALFEENTELIGKIKAMEKMVVGRHPMSFPLEQYEELLKENLELSRKIEGTIFLVYPRHYQRIRCEKLVRENLELSRKIRETIFEDYPRSLRREKYGELLRENRELSRKMRETISRVYQWSLHWETYEELLRENRELSRKMRETIFEDYPRSLQGEKYEELLRENLELSRKMRETIHEDYPRSHQREKFGELEKENRELSRNMRETIFEDYPRGIQGEKYEELLRENLELSRKMRETIFEDYPRSHQREKYGELVKENQELSRNIRGTIFEDNPRSLQWKKYEQFLKKSIEISREMRETIFEDYPRSLRRETYGELLRENRELSRKNEETIFEDYPRSLQLENYEELLVKNLELSRKMRDSEAMFEHHPSSLQFEKLPRKGIRAEEKTSITEIPGTEQTVVDWDINRKEDGKWISESTPPLAVTTASKESQLEGALTKGGQDLPSQSK